MSKYKDFDEEKATLRFLLELYSLEPLPRLLLIDEFEKEGIGRTAFYSALYLLKELKLIEDKNEVLSGKVVTYTVLTSKGRLVAEKLLEIREILEGPD